MDAVVDSSGLFVIVIQTWASFGKISHISCHACMYDLSAKQTDTPAKKKKKSPIHDLLLKLAVTQNQQTLHYHSFFGAKPQQPKV
jgi:hypothetical protein